MRAAGPDPLQVSNVAVFRGDARYARCAPFSPSMRFPECCFPLCASAAEANPAYLAVRGTFRLLGFDSAGAETAQWNPLGWLVRPGDSVVLKPNFVRHFRESSVDHADCLITHGSIIRAVVDYVYIALGGHGRIIIADAPQNDADFGTIRRIAGLNEIQEFYQRHAGFDVEVYDLRPERAYKIDGVIVGHERLAGDPAGYVKVNLGRHSAFTEISHLCHRLYGAEYDATELRRHHHGDVHEYLISKTVLDADAVINLPKLKTHKKVGLTACLKNLVGISGNKNWLPHHREGTPSQGGDQFCRDTVRHRLERAVVEQFKRAFPLLGPFRSLLARPSKALGKRIFGDTNNGTIRSGNWYGNDTAWRMVHDLNRILLYANATGKLSDRPVRRVFNVVDAIIAGEGNGPLDPVPKPVGLVAAGVNPVAVDCVCARLMGFDDQRIVLLARASAAHAYPLVGLPRTTFCCVSNQAGWNGDIANMAKPYLPFRPHPGWQATSKTPMVRAVVPQNRTGNTHD